MSEELVTSDVELDPEMRAFLVRTTEAYANLSPEEIVETIFTEDGIYDDHRPLMRGTVVGWEALKAYARTTLEMLPDFRVSAHVLDAVGNRYLARDTYIGHADLGGGEAMMQWWVVDELRDGKLAREDIYETEAEARAEFEARR